MPYTDTGNNFMLWFRSTRKGIQYTSENSREYIAQHIIVSEVSND